MSQRTTTLSSGVCTFHWCCSYLGGTAGCVLANRLSSHPSVQVLLVERGDVNDNLFASSVLLTHPPFGVLPAKGISIVPERELVDKGDKIYESLSLGGRTRINAGLYLPGCPAEYDSWGEGWHWNDIAPFFLRSEGRLELETAQKTKVLPGREGGEWKTRIVKAEYESSRQLAPS
jgi:choline dehydrogenase-like flavoprotein